MLLLFRCLSGRGGVEEGQKVAGWLVRSRRIRVLCFLSSFVSLSLVSICCLSLSSLSCISLSCFRFPLDLVLFSRSLVVVQAPFFFLSFFTSLFLGLSRISFIITALLYYQRILSSIILILRSRKKTKKEGRVLVPAIFFL